MSPKRVQTVRPLTKAVLVQRNWPHFDSPGHGRLPGAGPGGCACTRGAQCVGGGPSSGSHSQDSASCVWCVNPGGREHSSAGRTAPTGCRGGCDASRPDGRASCAPARFALCKSAAPWGGQPARLPVPRGHGAADLVCAASSAGRPGSAAEWSGGGCGSPAGTVGRGSRCPLASTLRDTWQRPAEPVLLAGALLMWGAVGRHVER